MSPRRLLTPAIASAATASVITTFACVYAPAVHAQTRARSSGGTDGRPVTYSLDRPGGTDRIRQAVEAGTVRALLAGWETDSARFTALRRPFLLY